MSNDFIPYGRQAIEADDIEALVAILKSDWLTTGPKIPQFEEAFANYVNAPFAVAVSNGTAALHAAMYAINLQEGDEVIVPPLTFAATANCVIYQKGIPVFADIDPDSLLIDPEAIEKKITAKTKAIIAVDYAGQPCNYNQLKQIANAHQLTLISDACHALGATYEGQMVGSIAELNIFSFHPVKHMTTGEGGMITTNNSAFYKRMKRFRNHGIEVDHHQRSQEGTWFYEMVDLGYNYRLTDFQSALGISQLKKIPTWVKQRQTLAQQYTQSLKELEHIQPLKSGDNLTHAYHLYVVKVPAKHRKAIFTFLREQQLGVNVHYVPVHLHPYYRRTFKTDYGLCPEAEAAYEQIISIPLFPQMTALDQERVVTALSQANKRFS